MIWDEGRWPHFSQSEFFCAGDGTCEMSPAFMDKLELLRDMYGKPMVITSGYRSPSYNAKVSGTGTAGPHTTGKACDIAVTNPDAHLLVQLAMKMNFTGIGVSQRGSNRFIHLDMCLPPDFPRPALWSY